MKAMTRAMANRSPIHRRLLPGGLLLLVLVLATAVSACKLVLPEEPEDPIYDNPVDPESPDYVPPATTITAGPTEGSTVTTNEVTFTWTGNGPDMLFRFRVNSGDWIGWRDTETVTLQYLDETTYTFEVQAAYNPGGGATPTQIEGTPHSRTFTVDAVTGPALRLSPTLTRVYQNDTFDIHLIAEDVSDLMLVATTIRFSPTRLEVVSLTHGSFLTSTGGSIAPYNEYDNAAGTIDVNMATATGSPAGVSGTGTVLTIRFRQKNTTNSTIWFAGLSSFLRDSNNDPITLNETATAAVVVY